MKHKTTAMKAAKNASAQEPTGPSSSPDAPTTDLSSLFRDWVAARMEALEELPPHTDRKHRKLRIQWADETEKSLRRMRDQLKVSG